MSKDKYIKALVEKFLDGRTTNAEEQQLYDWFAMSNVPEELADLKAMFAWYSSGMPENSVEPVVSKPKFSLSLSLRRRIMAISSAVAVVVIAMVVWISSREVNIYEGSYIIEQGTYCDNLDYIQEDIEALLEQADEIERRSNQLMALAD
jgi:hypothetical protein